MKRQRSAKAYMVDCTDIVAFGIKYALHTNFLNLFMTHC